MQKLWWPSPGRVVLYICKAIINKTSAKAVGMQRCRSYDRQCQTGMANWTWRQQLRKHRLCWTYSPARFLTLPFASGSGQYNCMIIIPPWGTLGRIAVEFPTTSLPGLQMLFWKKKADMCCTGIRHTTLFTLKYGNSYRWPVALSARQHHLSTVNLQTWKKYGCHRGRPCSLILPVYL